MVRDWSKIDNINHDLAGGNYQLVFERSFHGPGMIQFDITSLTGGSVDVLGCAFVSTTLSDHVVFSTTALTAAGTVAAVFIPETFAATSIAIDLSGTTGVVNSVSIVDRV